MIDTLPAGMQAIDDFNQTRQHARPLDRLAAVRKAAQGFRERFLAEPVIPFYQSIDLIRAPYPTWYGYSGVYTQSALRFPFIHILNRLFVLQYHDLQGQLKTLLFSPSDVEGNRETPFFKRLVDKLKLPRAAQNVMAPLYHDVPGALAQAGIRPEQVDYISYDHLHTQDIRRWLGTGSDRGYFPNARLLVHRQEWLSTGALLPCQADWYCPRGIEGVDPGRIVTFEGSIQLGRGVALLHTPGHTEGNHSLVARVPDGLRVTSENGVGADAYAPMNSRINAVRRYARATGMEVILNGNTLEGSNDQYLSMVMEKTVAGPSANPEFPNVATSSEATPYWLMPGQESSHLIGEARFGQPAR